MMAERMSIVALPSLVALGGGRALAEEGKPAEAGTLLRQRLATLTGVEGGELIPVTEEALARAFPQDRFYVLRFRQYPVAPAPPEPLQANNLFVVKPDGSVEPMRDADALDSFFPSALAPVMTAAQATGVVKAWLRLAQELHPDGFFEFSISDAALTVTSTAQGSHKVTGKTIVNPLAGDTGEMVASLTVDHAGGWLRWRKRPN